MIVYAYNPNTEETETGRLLIQGQRELHSETLSQKRLPWPGEMTQGRVPTALPEDLSS